MKKRKTRIKQKQDAIGEDKFYSALPSGLVVAITPRLCWHTDETIAGGIVPRLYQWHESIYAPFVGRENGCWVLVPESATPITYP